MGPGTYPYCVFTIEWAQVPIRIEYLQLEWVQVPIRIVYLQYNGPRYLFVLYIYNRMGPGTWLKSATATANSRLGTLFASPYQFRVRTNLGSPWRMPTVMIF